MSTELAFVEYLADQLELGEWLSWKRMFGEFAVYIDGKVVAFACDDSLLVKPGLHYSPACLLRRPHRTPRAAFTRSGCST